MESSDSHEGEDSDDGHRDKQLDGDDGVNLERKPGWGVGQHVSHHPPRKQPALPQEPQRPALMVGKGFFLNFEGSSLTSLPPEGPPRLLPVLKATPE